MTFDRVAASGPIPASAGETSAAMIEKILERAYPRKRGGNEPYVEPPRLSKGLSPQARGKRSAEADNPVSRGPIPASAGETLIAAEDR